MTLHLEHQDTPGGSFSALDLDALKIYRIKLSKGYTHPDTLTWRMRAPQQNMPIAINTFIRFWDDAGTNPNTGSAFNAANPIFEGFVHDASPGEDANEVEYLCYDSTRMAGHQITVMSTAWVSDSGSIVEGVGAIPRLIFNSTIDNDDDWAFERAHDLTLGQILATIFNDALLPLRYFNAAPSGSTAYVQADLDGLPFRPQEKMVFESESIRSAIDRLMAWEPAVRIFFIPGTANRKWRFANLYDAPQVTITLNAHDIDNVVLSGVIRRSMEDRFTAVKFYGPASTVVEVFNTADGTLGTYGSPTTLEVINDITPNNAYSAWQIVDPDKRRGARLLPLAQYAPVGSYFYALTRAPTLQYSFDGGNTFNTQQGPTLDFQNGIAGIGDTFIYIYIDPPPLNGSNQRFFLPNAMRLVWAPFVDPLTVRYPTSGFSGTAYTVCNEQGALRLYDEMLAIGYEYGTPVSSVARLNQYSTLAQAMQLQRRDLIYTGGLVLDGIDYEYAFLNRRINIAGKDADGNALTTGWESIGAALTDVEYDYSNSTTTLLLSSDQLELIGFSPEFLKSRLQIRPLLRVVSAPNWAGAINFGKNSVIWSTQHVEYIDPYTGQAEIPISLR
jgi:hypothetical protein